MGGNQFSEDCLDKAIAQRGGEGVTADLVVLRMSRRGWSREAAIRTPKLPHGGASNKGLTRGQIKQRRVGGGIPKAPD